jgi:hypothetical protein
MKVESGAEGEGEEANHDGRSLAEQGTHVVIEVAEQHSHAQRKDGPSMVCQGKDDRLARPRVTMVRNGPDSSDMTA